MRINGMISQWMCQFRVVANDRGQDPPRGEMEIMGAMQTWCFLVEISHLCVILTFVSQTPGVLFQQTDSMSYPFVHSHSRRS